MTGEALFLFPLFRGVLRLGGDRRVLARARCSEHEVVRDMLIGVAESRVWKFTTSQSWLVTISQSPSTIVTVVGACLRAPSASLASRIAP